MPCIANTAAMKAPRFCDACLKKSDNESTKTCEKRRAFVLLYSLMIVALRG